MRVGMQYYLYVHREPRIEDTGNSITTPFLGSVPGGDPTQMTPYTKRKVIFYQLLLEFRNNFADVLTEFSSCDQG